jgi:hypothetical protein
MRLLGLIRRRQCIKAATQLMDPSLVHPARQLPVNIIRVDVTGKEQAGFEQDLISQDLKQAFIFHGNILPLMATYCNGFVNVWSDFSVLEIQTINVATQG